LDIKDIKKISNLLQENDEVAKFIVKQIATWIGAAIYATTKWLK